MTTSREEYDWLKMGVGVVTLCCERAIRAELLGAAANGSMVLAVELSQFSASEVALLGSLFHGFPCVADCCCVRREEAVVVVEWWLEKAGRAWAAGVVVGGAVVAPVACWEVV